VRALLVDLLGLASFEGQATHDGRPPWLLSPHLRLTSWRGPGPVGASEAFHTGWFMARLTFM
jgi:hypothetical protein